MSRIAVVFVLLLASACTNVSKLDLSSVGSRALWQRPDDVVRLIGIAPGDSVADIGAGEGYFEPFLSEAVGAGGAVYAVEVDPEVVPNLETNMKEQQLENVRVVRGEFDDPMLPDGELDVVLVVNTFHHIEDRPDYFRRLQGDLAPGGRVAVLEPNEELGGVLSLFLDEGHTSRASEVRADMIAAGYASKAVHEDLPVQIFEVFEVAPADR